MNTANHPLKTEFDGLYADLLTTLQEERQLRADGSPYAALVDVKDRLHSLRSELATVREQLAAAQSRPAWESIDPTSGRRHGFRSEIRVGRAANRRARLAPDKAPVMGRP